jgi:hypothetical protein
MPAPRDIRERLIEKIEVDEYGCWLFAGNRSSSGYGLIHHNGRQASAHRVSYELHVGLIAEGLELDHLCRVRACVNPAHLEPVTRAENNRRGDGAIRKLVCPRGHWTLGDNAITRRDGTRWCRTCKNEESRRRRAAT